MDLLAQILLSFLIPKNCNRIKKPSSQVGGTVELSYDT